MSPKCLSVVNHAPVPDRHDENNEAIVFDGCNDTIVANAVTPETFKIAAKWLSEASRVLGRGNTLTQVTQDRSLRGRAELAQLAGRGGIELDAPEAWFIHAALWSLGEFTLKFL